MNFFQQTGVSARGARGILGAMWLPGLVFAMLGCQALIGASDGVECVGNLDCYDGETCNRQSGRCVFSGLTQPDSRVRDMGPVLDFWVEPDVRLDPAEDATVDGARDAEVAGDEGTPDAFVRPDWGSAPFEDGRCSETQPGVVRTQARGEHHVPRAWCGSHATVWTAGGRPEPRVHVNSGEGRPTPAPVEVVDPSAVAVDGPVLYVISRRDDDDRTPLVRRLDIRLGAEASASPDFPFSSAGHHQRQVTTGDGRIGFGERLVEAGGTRWLIRATGPDGVSASHCPGRAGSDHWGLHLERGVAVFFARRIGQRRTALVVVEGEACDPNRQPTRMFDLEGAVPDEARVVATDDAYFWLQGELVSEGRREVWWLPRDFSREPTPFEPARNEGGNVFEITGRGRMLPPTPPPPGGGRLQAFRRGGDGSWEAQCSFAGGQGANAVHPVLGETTLQWAEEDALRQWRLHFRPLEAPCAAQ